MDTSNYSPWKPVLVGSQNPLPIKAVPKLKKN